eukprot:scaffold2642_cov120-Cylindrotheca_fusiformis.AAC.10
MNNLFSATAIGAQMPSYSTLLEAYQQEKARNQMIVAAASGRPQWPSASNQDPSNLLALLQNEAAYNSLRTARQMQQQHVLFSMPSGHTSSNPTTSDNAASFLAAIQQANMPSTRSIDRQLANSNIFSSNLMGRGDNSTLSSEGDVEVTKNKKLSTLTDGSNSFANVGNMNTALLSYLSSPGNASTSQGQAVPPIPPSLFSAASDSSTNFSSNASLLARIQAAKQLTSTPEETEPSSNDSSSKQSTEERSCAAHFVEPLPNDVLFGKGRTKYRGNRGLQRIIEDLMGVYESATKQQKKELADMTVSKITRVGGRFLKLDDETQRWKQVSKEEAHKKVAHAFRNLRRRNK